MKIGKKELFAIKELNDYNEKYAVREQAIKQKIAEYEQSIFKTQNEYEIALENDILEDSSDSHTRLANIDSKLKNLCELRNTELSKLGKLQELKANGVQKLIPEAKKQLVSDLYEYYNTVEYELFKQLAQAREKQEELLLLLQKARNVVGNELFEFDRIAEEAGQDRQKFNISNTSFHQSTNVPHRSFPELGLPLLSLNTLSAIEPQLSRNRADVNSVANRDKAPEDKVQLPPAKTLADVDLEKFLDSIKTKK